MKLQPLTASSLAAWRPMHELSLDRPGTGPRKSMIMRGRMR
jgi:hypothetical protein